MATLLLAVLPVLSLSFHAGGGGTLARRNGARARLTLACSEASRPHGPWLAPAGRSHDRDPWTVTLPLWIPLLLSLGWHLAARRGR